MYGSPLSAEIYQFAEANRLGDPIASYEMRPKMIRRYSGPPHITIALPGSDGGKLHPYWFVRYSINASRFT
jgi:hypothetical protein